MIRRIVRIFGGVVYLLSLLLAAVAACLWWEARRGHGYVADGSALGTYVMVESNPGGRAGAVVVRGWPGRATTLRLWTRGGYYADYPVYWSPGRRPTSQPFRIAAGSGSPAVLLRVIPGVPVPGNPGPMTAWYADNMPFWLVITGVLTPVLLLEGVRLRHGRERRRRLRHGLCLACGYDLRHSPERCPECGAAIADEKPCRGEAQHSRLQPSSSQEPRISPAR